MTATSWNYIQLWLLTALVGLTHSVRALGAETEGAAFVAPYNRSAGPTALKLDVAFSQSRPKPAEVIPIMPDSNAHIGAFATGSAPFTGLVANQWPEASYCNNLVWNLRPAADTLLVGERRLAVIVHSTNNIGTIRLSELHRVLAAPEGDPAYAGRKRWPSAEWPRLSFAPTTWLDVGGRSYGAIRVYIEGRSSWAREALGVRCMKHSEPSSDGIAKQFRSRPFRSDVAECIDADDIVKRVRRDPAGIGFVNYTGQPLKGVRVLAVEDDFPPDWPFAFGLPGPVLPVSREGVVEVAAWSRPEAKRPTGPIALKLGKFLQPEYPLSEPLLLFVHPKAPQNVKDFAAFCVSEEGSRVAETLGLITPRMDAESKAQERLAALRNGEGTPIGIVGDGALRKLMRQVGLAYTREKRPVVIKYESAKPEDVAKIFVKERYAAMISFAAPNTTMVAREWQALESAGLQTTTLGARALAVIVHPSNPRRHFTGLELQQIVSGQVRDWRALAAPTAAQGGGPAPGRDMREDCTMRLCLPERESPANTLLVQRLSLTQVAKCERLETDAEILAAVASDVNALGIVNVASLPAGTVMEGKRQEARGNSGKSDAATERRSDEGKLKTQNPKIKNPIDPEVKQGFAVVALGKAAAWPKPDDIFAGRYPLAEHLTAYQRAGAPEHTKALLAEWPKLEGLRAALLAAGITVPTPTAAPAQ
jgi:ABC-type phosphate transport system substrate-binding protein